MIDRAKGSKFSSLVFQAAIWLFIGVLLISATPSEGLLVLRASVFFGFLWWISKLA